MKRYQSISLLCAAIALLHSAPRFAVGAPKARAPAVRTDQLSYAEAVKRALDKNFAMQNLRINFDNAKMNFDNAWDAMFLPSVNLNLSSASNYTLTHLTQTPADQAGPPGHAKGYPRSVIELNLGSYTLFNSWKDRITYDMASLAFEREKQRYREQERAVRFAVAGAYFRLFIDQEKLDAANRSVVISEAIYNVVKSGRRIGKSSDSDVSSANVDLLNAKTQNSETARNIKSSLWALNQLLGDPNDTQYRLTTELPYVKLRLTLAEAIKIYESESPSIRDARLSVNNASMALDLAEKNRLPLPKIALSGLVLSYGNAYYGSSQALSTGTSPDGNINISASISLSIPIIGPGGIINGRTMAQARNARDLAELSYTQRKSDDLILIRNLIEATVVQEATIENQKTVAETTAELLEKLVGEMPNRRIPRLELRDALTQARQAELSFKDAALNHFTAKLGLATLIGADHLPGDML